MDILAAEQDLETKLGTDITGIKVEAFPDDPDKYYPLHPKGAILIRYNRSTYQEPEQHPRSQKIVRQIRLAEWIITILYKNLKSHTQASSGVYTYIENVRTSLTGYTITNKEQWGMFYPVQDGFVDHPPGLWRYDFTFHHTAPETEDFQ